MFEVQMIDGVTVVSGYEDRKAWFVESASYEGLFGAGGARLWQLVGGEIRILDPPARAILDVVPLGLRSIERRMAIASPTGEKIWVQALSPNRAAGETAGENQDLIDLVAVDLEQRTVIARLTNQNKRMDPWP